MKARISVLTAAITAAVILGQFGARAIAQQAQDWLPKWTEEGRLILPEGYREWVYLGSPLTPNTLNGGAAAVQIVEIERNGNAVIGMTIYVEPGISDAYGCNCQGIASGIQKGDVEESCVVFGWRRRLHCSRCSTQYDGGSRPKT